MRVLEKKCGYFRGTHKGAEIEIERLRETTPPVLPLRVKPLEWRKGYCDERVTIHQASNGWLYQVRILDGVVWLDWPDRAATQFPSEEAAKEAVQSDYERRVLASLADPARQEQMRGIE